MDAEQIKDVLVEVGMRRGDLKVIHGWVSTKCPLATWKHQKRRDSAPSSGVSIRDEPIFNCFTCGTKKPLFAMVEEYATYTGDDFSDLVDELRESAYLGPTSLPSWDNLKEHRVEEELMPLHEGLYMDLYEPAVGHPYLRERGISDATVEKLELRFDPEDRVDREMGVRGVGRILFPVRGPNGALYGFSGRDVTGKSKIKARDYEGLKKAFCVLGSHLLASENPPHVEIVEGLFDYANMVEQGYYPGAVMHSSMTEAQANIFRDLGKPTYMLYDDDDAGDKGVLEASRLLVDYTPIMQVRYPEVWIENPHEEDGGHYVKDPGELLRDEIEWMLQDARIITPRDIRNMEYKVKQRQLDLTNNR